MKKKNILKGTNKAPENYMESRNSLTLQRRIEFHAYFILAPFSYGFVWYILTKRKVKMAGYWQDGLILPSRVASQSTGFASYCPRASSAILIIIMINIYVAIPYVSKRKSNQPIVLSKYLWGLSQFKMSRLPLWSLYATQRNTWLWHSMVTHST